MKMASRGTKEKRCGVSTIRKKFSTRVILVALLSTILSLSYANSHTLYAPYGNEELISPITNDPIQRLRIRSVETLNSSLGLEKDFTTTRVTGNATGDHSGSTGMAISYETKWFEQQIDHFSWANNDTFQQRYLVNASYWCGRNCPILFYCGNEGDIEAFTNNTGWMWENAQSLHAMLIFAEHRYYGQSVPYNIDTTKVDPNNLAHLGYLSSEQALADYAELIFKIKNELYDAKLSPVIAIGGSYGGMLAGWMRMKYPNLVQGALAGSAPIYQFPEEYECGQFMRIVTKDYENYSPNCSLSIARSWQIIRDFTTENILDSLGKVIPGAVKTDVKGLKELSKIFNTCSIMTADERDLLLVLLGEIWTNMAMTDYANEANFLSKMPAYAIKHACSNLNRNPNDLEPTELIRGISLASQVYTNFTGQSACLNLTQYLSDPMEVMWDFQSCSEMVMPICSDGINDMFEPQPFDVEDFVKGCKSRWGLNTRPNNVRTMYGTRVDLATTSNIIFSSCSRDPWSAGCPQDSIESKSIHAIKIEGVCHHEDLRASGPNDPPELKAARQMEVNIISDWIKEYFDNVKRTQPDATLSWRKID